MKAMATTRTALVLVVIAVMVPALLMAAEPEDKEQQNNPTSISVIDDSGERVTITLEDGAMTIISSEDGQTTTQIMDVEAMSLMAADALDGAFDGMDEVLEQLAEMQIQVRMGEDNRMNLSYDETEFELDLDQVLAQVASAVKLGLDEIDTDDWTSQHGRWDDVSDSELRDELDNLKDEMKDLRRELRRLQKEAHRN